MAISWTIRESFVIGDRKMVIASGQFDSSYPTGGEPIQASDFGLGEIEFVAPNQPSVNVALTGITWVRSTSTLMAIAEAGTQVANATNLSATNVECIVIGR